METWGIGILAQIFILGVGLWMLQKILNRKTDIPDINMQVLTKKSHDSICQERLGALNKNLEIKFDFINSNFQDLKTSVREIQDILRKKNP